MSDIPGNPDFVQEKHRDLLNKIAAALDEAFNPNMPFREVGFALLMFDFAKPEDTSQRMNYISNSKRADMVKALKEFISYAEKDTGPEVRHPKVN